MSSVDSFKYSQCLFEARLQKPSFLSLRKRQQLYLYVSPNYIIINHQPYAKKPQLILQLLPTTHVKWLWENRRNSISKIQKQQIKQNPKLNHPTHQPQLKGFIIETESFVGEYIAEKVVLQELKSKFQKIILQSDFYDEYSLGKYLDKGNYAMVYQCTHKSSNKRYAVKILEKERLKTMKNGKESVFNELKILRKLNHPNLMHLEEVFEDRNKYYFVLELLNGITLYKEIQSRRKKSELDFKSNQIKGILKQILSGVSYLHDINIMHRDLKPQNIIFEEKDCLMKGDGSTGLKIVDYGLATYQHEKDIIFTKCGTPGFVAPEVIIYDQRQPIYQTNVDIFSVGVIFHILLVGEQTFPGRSRNTILNKNKQCKIDYKSKKYEAIGSDGLDLLMKMLEKVPEKRISAKQALQHSFLTKDKPIFKFKKSYKEESTNDDNKAIPVQKYLNFEDITNDNTKNLPSNNIQSNLELQHYDPFAYDIMQLPSQHNFDSFSSNRDKSQSVESKRSQESQKKRKSSMHRKILTTYKLREETIEDKNNIANFFYYIP